MAEEKQTKRYNITRRLEFARLIADGCDPVEAVKRAGYGTGEAKGYYYYAGLANKFMQDKNVLAMIDECRASNESSEETVNEQYSQSIIENLMSVVKFDYGDVFDTATVEEKGRKKDYVYYKKRLSDWSPQSRILMIDSVGTNGELKFVSKQWAYNMLIKLLGLDKSGGVDVEDLVGTLAKAGVSVRQFENTGEEEIEEALGIEQYDEEEEEFYEEELS